MGDSSEVTDARGRCLDSWKEIAEYLRRSERTVRRWEEAEGLPVHRLQHDKRGSVFAYTAELEAWRDSRKSAPEDERPVAGGRPERAERLDAAERHDVAAAPRPSLLRSGRWRLAASAAVVMVAIGVLVATRLPAAPQRTPHPEAVRLLQQGRFTDNAGRTQIETGLRYYRQAVSVDPEFSGAWGAMAMSHVALTWFADRPATETMGEAKKAADRARELDPSSTTAPLVYGWASHYVDWDHAAAEQHFERAITISPRYAVAHSWKGDVLTNLGRFDEALRSYRAALDASPRWLEPMSLIGTIHTIRGHYDLAIAEHQRALAIEPGHNLANHLLGRSYLAKGDAAAALGYLRKSTEAMGRVPFSLGDLGYALAIAGERTEAEQLLAELKARRAAGYYPAFPLALIELGLGHTDAALDWLDAAADERHMGFYMPSADPLYDSLRKHPRFRALLERLRLPTTGR